MVNKATKVAMPVKTPKKFLWVVHPHERWLISS